MIDIADYENYDALGLAELVAAGEVTAAELVETAIARAEALNPQLNAIIVKHYERARNLAALGNHPAPFNGVPFLTKDLAMVDGDVATEASPAAITARSEASRRACILGVYQALSG